MHRMNNAVIMQTEQLGRIEALALGARGPGNQQKHLEYITGSGWKYLPLTRQ